MKTEQTPAAVLFDLDGTLIDTAPDFIRCLNQLRQQHGMPALPAEQIRRSVSNGARAMIRVGFGLEPEHEGYPEKHTAFLDLYELGVAVETTLFPGMDVLLSSLESRGIPWGIVTNKPARFAVPLIEALDLAQRCAALICPDHVAERKPHPESLLLACRQIQVEPIKSVYVGDHERDIEAGRNAGMHTIAVRYGYIEQPETVDLWQADRIADTVSDLTKLLQ
ncbi:MULTISPECIES: phosphoglycolate phosphatase [Marinobacter]|uniref:phosphoglycolate phosphatase n=1 Tax=Marinobacter nauticus (strain ATCC 700491 / DSM 11845 / VT8) TaxID=351348 RepID=A1U3K2_MARN8|nr:MULTISPECIES: phosphoglycolate phosphatase [Marinobacter]MEC8822680.1 phosphoglycolate phosphatase [Pseudomonadota bacterium]ABM19571.1 phosphoglycolate phosphatase [Marinobacter nauticus VT8]MBY5963745.1 phosphoglycolate phosphatase [Marinobacter nauticus]MEC9040716.1 phosphoglycolate phosphatase [Pseudomonadota bacterium]MEC9387752.1 phosphoglycolate phosphatase [Pseudomonadota bacterium]